MLKLAPINVLQPGTRADLAAAITSPPNEFKILAGGTDLINGLKKRLHSAATLISLKKVAGLKYITYNQNQDQLAIGAMTTLSQLATNHEVAEYQPGIIDTARLIAAPPIRNQATVGGNICLDTRCFYYNQSQSWRKLAPPCFKCGGKTCNAAPGAKMCRAVFSADLPPLLLALNAEITISTGTNERTLPLKDFYTGKGATPSVIQKNEYVVGTTISNLKSKTAIYRKFRLRKALDFPLAGLALAFDRNSTGKFINPQIFINAVAPAPLDVPEAAARLSGKSFSDEKALATAAAALSKAAQPIANIGSKPFYRKKMVGLILKKMAQELAVAKEA